MIRKDERSLMHGMVQSERRSIVAAWIAMFFAGLLFIPTAVFLSLTYYPSAAVPTGWVSQGLYFSGFFLLTWSFHEITRKKAVGIVALVAGIVMAMMPMTPMIMIAGSGIAAAGLSIVATVLAQKKSGGGRRVREAPKPPIRLSKPLKGLACVALLVLAGHCLPSTCFAIATASPSVPNATNSNTIITIGETTIESISDSSVKIYDVLGTIITLEFNGSHVIFNGEAIEISSLLPSPSNRYSNSPARGATTSGTFWWDSIQFAFGQYIKYSHPDRDYYGVSPYSDWNHYGTQLLHYQLNDQMSSTLVRSALPFVVAALGTIIGTLVIGPPYGSLIGGIVGAVFGIYMYWVGCDLLDEKACVWWWSSRSYNKWLSDNTLVLAALYAISPPLAVSMAASAFSSLGYLSMGKMLYFDALGAGMPRLPYVPTLGLRRHCGSGGCFMR